MQVYHQKVMSKKSKIFVAVWKVTEKIAGFQIRIL
jgi:hypothetical protein